MEDTVQGFFRGSIERAINIISTLINLVLMKNCDSVDENRIGLMVEERSTMDCGTQVDLELTSVNVPMMTDDYRKPEKADKYSAQESRDDGLNGDLMLSPPEPTLARSDPVVVATQDKQGNHRYGLVINEDIIESYNNISGRDTKAQKIKLDFRKIEKAKNRLRQKAERTGGIADEEARNEETVNHESQLGDLDEKIRDCETSIESLQRSMDFEKNWIIELVENALIEAELLKKQGCRQTDATSELTDDEDAKEAESGDDSCREAIEEPSQPQVSEEQRAQDAARDAAREGYIHFKDAYICAQYSFNFKEDSHEQNRVEYEAAVEAGEPAESQTVFDQNVLIANQDLTRGLIDAESNFFIAEEQAVQAGVLFELEQESDYGYGEDIADVEEKDLVIIPLSAAKSNSISAWIESIFEPEVVEAEEMIYVDDWESKTVQVSDSLSVVDDEPRLRRKIDQWARMGELKRRDFEFAAEDVWATPERPLKRRRTCSS
ncbi:uncharacterized protein KY384_002628 [Bacidia gigantensis]|uniref:uncharacterized protein n=1 Tax=Bacidia gigantensis TaxID=2732470 RepID=UPI001D05AB5A|nr:uncharacterized protein KY384_002628 [Bacidia gigantensis]KAG8532750.1 hypothetical protein KY384_002628 [Bacidia gigantensis]